MKKILISCFLLLASFQSIGLTAIPFFSQRINDTTHTLTEQQIKALDSLLIEFERPRTDGAQIAVLMIDKLDGETIEQYASRVFAEWKIGKQGVDNGILLLIAKGDHRMRIEVGYGLEGTITDVTASHIIRNQLAPQFKLDNYYRGIENGLTALIQFINQPHSNTKTEDEGNKLEKLFNSEFGPKLIFYGLFSFAVCFIIGKRVPLALFKNHAGRNLGTAFLNAISVSGFTLISGYTINLILPLLFLVFVASTILNGIFSVPKNRRQQSLGGSKVFGRNNHRGGGGFGSGPGGGFGGGGGGRSGGGGASSGW